LVYYVGIFPEGDVLMIDNWKDESLLSIPTPEMILNSPPPWRISSTWNISSDGLFNSKSRITKFMDSAGLTTISNQKNTPSSNEPKKIKPRIYPFLSRSRCFRENVPIYLKSSDEVRYLSLNIFIIHIYERLFDKKGLITLTKLSTLNMTNIRFPEGHNEKKDGIYEVLDSAILNHNLIHLIPNGDPNLQEDPGFNPLKGCSLGVCFSDNLIEEREGKKVIDIYDDTGINPSVLHTMKEGNEENPTPRHFHSSFGNELKPMCRIDLNRVVSSSQELAHYEETSLKMWSSHIHVKKMLDLRFAEFQFSEGGNGIDSQLQDSLSNEIEKMSINEEKDENIEGSDMKKDVVKIMNSIITLGQVQNLSLKLHYINGKLTKAQEQVLYHTYFNLMNNRLCGNKSLEILANFLFHI